MADKKPIKKTRPARHRQPPQDQLTPSRTPGAGLRGGYAELLEELKTRVRASQVKAALSVNRELIQLFWDIGKRIVERQEQAGWGARIIDRLAHDLKIGIPEMQGFSSSNVSRMRAFYLAYSKTTANSAQAVPKSRGRKSAQRVPKTAAILPAPVAEIPWGHNIILLFKLTESRERLWYAQQVSQHGWSRAVLSVQIETDISVRQKPDGRHFMVS